MEEFYARRTLIGATLAAGRPAFDAAPWSNRPAGRAARAEALSLARDLANQAAEDILKEQAVRFVTMSVAVKRPVSELGRAARSL